ncbi:hypothetical protein [Ideonella sp. BN130291]|uniref:hypothetical protein n=1 Tax=Ideonella sp. BN130291 TaxID=3112940 RepID=UPI002E25806C|nr:hypothetical protein [Ideonella sp. BN130291]
MPAELKSIGSPERQRQLQLKPRGSGAVRVSEPRSEQAAPVAAGRIRPSDAVPPVAIPPGHVGPVVLPGTGRLVYWTGRVAIGLRHQRSPLAEPVSQSALWVQDLMLGKGASVAA